MAPSTTLSFRSHQWLTSTVLVREKKGFNKNLYENPRPMGYWTSSVRQLYLAAGEQSTIQVWTVVGE